MGPIVWRAPTWRYMYSRSLFLLLVAVCIVDGARAEDLADNDKPGEDKTGRLHLVSTLVPYYQYL